LPRDTPQIASANERSGGSSTIVKRSLGPSPRTHATAVLLAVNAGVEYVAEKPTRDSSD
jgi:hypothetical protein